MFLLNVFFPVKYKNLVVGYCNDLGVDSALVFAVINTESHFDESAVSSAGAVGLMQILPSTAEFVSQLMGVEYSEQDLFKPEMNLRLGIFYLGYLLNRFDERSAIAAYNAGEGTVRGWINQQGILYTIPYPETQKYVSKVLAGKEVYNWLIG